MELMSYAARISNPAPAAKDERLIILSEFSLLHGNVLIIGGGLGHREALVLKRMGFTGSSDSTLVCIDPHPPDELKLSFPMSSVIHAPFVFDPSLSVLNAYSFDCVLCLGASRYLDDPHHFFNEVFCKLPHGSIAIIDYLNIGPCKHEVNKCLRKELLDSYLRSPSQMWSLIDDLVSLSIAIGKQSYGLVSLQSNSSIFPSSSLTLPVHKILYDFFFPFWYRKGSSRETCTALLIWSVLCVSPPGITCQTIAEVYYSADMHPLEIIQPVDSNTVTVYAQKVKHL